MKKIIFSLLLAVVILFTAGMAEARFSRVRGYFKKSGTYVQPYYRTAPNRTKFDNWSFKGNINPFTGKRGYKLR